LQSGISAAELRALTDQLVAAAEKARKAGALTDVEAVVG
jgi:hypothetical protein